MVHFNTWLFEQIDDLSPATRFAKLAWDDVNNGCAHIRFSVQMWEKHFSERHPDTSEILIRMLLDCYIIYLREVKGKFAL